MKKKKPSKTEKQLVKKFKRGTVVVFEPNNLNQKFWNGLTEKDRVKYYGPLGYGQEKLKMWVFLTEIRNAPGHCVLVSKN